VPFSAGSSFHQVDLQALAESPDGKKSWAAFESNLETYWASVRMARNQWERTGKKFELWSQPQVDIAGVKFTSPVINDFVRPLVLTQEVSEVDIPVDSACTRLHILGQVSFPQGFPLAGAYGETAATYTLHFANRRVQVLPVRHGIEVAQANRIYGATRIHPIATAAQPALEYIKDKAREHYRVMLWSVPVDGQKLGQKLVKLQCQLHAGQSPLAIFAITAEQAAN
jgi:hypothetical protein